VTRVMHAGLALRAFKLMAAAPLGGCLVEFGVYKGDGLCMMAHLCRQYLGDPQPLYGFDSFAGMPRSDIPLSSGLGVDWAEGTFADTSVEAVQQRLTAKRIQATLVKGVFGSLLPLREYGIETVRFVHIDADIYEGYRDALHLLTPHVQVGTVLLFDESMPPTDHRRQGIREHGKRAVYEWEQTTGFNLHLIRFHETAVLCVLVDESYLERYARTIVPLKRDTVMDIVVDRVQLTLRERERARLRRIRNFLRGIRRVIRRRSTNAP